jgi:hypothetical protein
MTADPNLAPESTLLLGAPAGRGRGQILRSLALGLGIVCIAGLGFLIGIASGVRGPDVTMLGLAMLTVIVGCIPLVLDQSRAPWERHIFMSLIALIFMAHYVLPALMLYIPAIGPVDASSTAHTNLLPRDVIAGQQMALIGLVALLLGYGLPLGSTVAAFLPKPRCDWSLPVLVGISILMLPIGWAMTLAIAMGILPPELGTGVIGVIANANIYANVLLAYAFLRHRSLFAGIVIAANTLAFLVYGLLTSRKMDMLIGAAVVVLTSMILSGRIRVRWMVLAFAALVMIYPVSELVRLDLLKNASVGDLIRNPGYTLGEVSSFVSQGHLGLYLQDGFEATSHRIDGLGITSVIVRDTPSLSPFQQGRTLKLFFIAFVPRILWSGKPKIHIGQWITDVYGTGPHVEANTAPTPIGEFYLNFGVAGVIGGMLVLGVVLRLAHETLSKCGITAPTLLAQVIILISFGLQFAGAVAGQYSKIAFILIPLALLHLVIRTLTPTIPVARKDEIRVRVSTAYRGQPGGGP